MHDPQIAEIQTALGSIARDLSKTANATTEVHVKVDQIHSWVKRLTDDRMRDRFDVDRAIRRVARVERQLAVVSDHASTVPDWEPDPRDITGTHQFDQIKRDFEERQATQKWWRQQVGKTVLTIAAGLVLASIVGCAGYALAQIRTAAPTEQRSTSK